MDLTDDISLRTERSQTWRTGRAVGIGKEERITVFRAAPVFLPDLKTVVDLELSRLSGQDMVFDRLAGGAKVTFDPKSASYTLEKDGKALRYEGPAASLIAVQGREVHYLTTDGVQIRFTVRRSMVTQKSLIPDATVPVPQFKRIGNAAAVETFVMLRPQAFDPDTLEEILKGDVSFGPNGEILTGLDLSKLKSWPKGGVLVDPTSTFNPSAGDGYVRNVPANGTWAANIATAQGTSAVATDTEGSNPVAQFTDSSSQSICGRHYEAYDTSSLPDNATPTAGSITKYCNDLAAANPDTQSYNYFEGTQASTTTLATTDFNKYGTVAWATAIAYTALTLGANPAWAANIWTLNPTGYGAINLTGFTKFCFRISADYAATAPTSGSNNYFRTANSEDPNQPSLSVTYTTPATGNPGAAGLMRGIM